VKRKGEMLMLLLGNIGMAVIQSSFNKRALSPAMAWSARARPAAPLSPGRFRGACVREDAGPARFAGGCYSPPTGS
jgi:hypothetical protein